VRFGKRASGVCVLLTGWLAVSSSRPLAAQTIDSIAIERHDVFTGDVAKTFYGRIANALHIVTRDGAIRRELLLRPGQPYDSALAAEGARNLRRLGVFRRVRVDTATTDSLFVLRYRTDDGWSTKADFRFGSTGDELTWTIGAYEDNLLGTAAQLAFEHRETPDRSTNTFFFQKTRLIADRVAVRAEYIDKSDGWEALGQIGVPWLSVRSRARGVVSVLGRDERVLRYRDGDGDPVDSLRRVETIVRGDVGYALQADPRQYLRFGLMGQGRRADFAAWESPDTIGRTVTGEVQGWVERSRVRFMVLDGFRTFAHQEDIDLSTTLRLGVAVAPSAFGHEETAVGPVVAFHTGAPLGAEAFVTADVRHNSLRGGVSDSGTTRIASSLGWVAGKRHVFVAHAEAGWLEDPAPGGEFDLGFGVGPRAFGTHAFTGDRQYFLTTEYRYTVNPDLWGLVGIGLAAFADHGGSWFRGDARRTGTDLGVGLRLGPSRATSLAVVRVDLAYRFANDREQGGWVVVIGKGFVFEELF
jgi:hypothetical protein